VPGAVVPGVVPGGMTNRTKTAWIAGIPAVLIVALGALLLFRG
jgi:hypothetical protein